MSAAPATWSTGKPPTLTREPSYLVTRHFFFESAKATREFAYQPVPLRTMVEQSYDWLRQEGLLTADVASRPG